MDKILGKLQPIVEAIKRYSIVVVVIAVGSVYGYLIYSSGKLAEVQPSEKSINEKYQGAKRPKIKNEVIEKLNQLEDNNVQFQALIDEARRNPFLEE